jgi:hypothetical protein
MHQCLLNTKGTMTANFKPNTVKLQSDSSGSDGSFAPMLESLTPVNGTVFTLVSVLLLAALVSRTHRRQPSQSDSGESAQDLDGANVTSEWPSSETRFCPLCFQESSWPTDHCEDCGVMLVDEEELPEETAVEIEEGVIPVARLQNLVTAHLARSFLLANEVPCTICNSIWGSVGSDVLVFESDALRARRLLNRFLFVEAA